MSVEKSEMQSAMERFENFTSHGENVSAKAALDEMVRVALLKYFRESLCKKEEFGPAYSHLAIGCRDFGIKMITQEQLIEAISVTYRNLFNNCEYLLAAKLIVESAKRFNMWDLESLENATKFVGHATEEEKLISGLLRTAQGGGSPPSSSEYF